jgi:hypothetical protein
MPTFMVTDPTTGQQLKLTGDSPPTETELEEIFASQQRDPGALEAVTRAEPPAQRPSAFLPTGEGLTQEQRQQRAEEIIPEAIEPILTGTGAFVGGTLGTALGPAGTIGGAGLGAATGERLAEALGGKEVGTVAEEAKEFGKDVLRGAAIEATGLGIGKVAAKGVDALKNQLFQSAVKFSNKLSTVERQEVINAALDQKIFPTEAGLANIGKKIKQVNTKIDDAVKKASERGFVRRDKVVKAFDSVKRLFKHDENAGEILGQIEARKQRFIAEHGPILDARAAQEMKIGLNKDLKNAFGEVQRQSKEGSKALRRALRIELEKLNPQLRALNRDHKTLKALDREIENAVKRIGNRELLSLLATTTAAAGGTAAGSPEAGVLTGLAVQLIVSPRTKTGVSIALDRALKSAESFTATRRFTSPALINLLSGQ